MNEKSNLPSALWHAFANQFEADVIDLDDTWDVMFRAESVALDAIAAGLSSAEIAGPLQNALRSWTPELVAEFCNAGNVNWEFDEETEAMLKTIIYRIILTAQGGGTLATRISEEEYRRIGASGKP